MIIKNSTSFCKCIFNNDNKYYYAITLELIISQGSNEQYSYKQVIITYII